MPTFTTPRPLDVTIQLVVGDVRVTAADRHDTVVVARPSNPGSPADVTAAQQVRIDHSDGRLQVKTVKTWKALKLIGGSGSVDLTIELPSGSRVEADLAMGAYTADGELGRSRFRTGMGNVRLDRVGPLELKTGYGDVEVDLVDGDADVNTGSGRIHLGEVRGDAVVRNGNGATEVDAADGDVRVKSSNGAIEVGRAAGSSVVKTANGRIRFQEVIQGSIVAETGVGSVEVGIRPGTAAWLDLASGSGDVRNGLDPGGLGTPGERTVEVRVRTGHGDIVIRRAAQHHETSVA